MMLLNRENSDLFLNVLLYELPYGLLVDAREAFRSAAEESHTIIEGTPLLPTQRSTVTGQMRYFQNTRVITNLIEKYGTVEKIPGADRIVTGRVNGTLLTFTAIGPTKKKPRFSVQRGKLAEQNRPFSVLSQADFFETPSAIECLTVWLEVRYEGCDDQHPRDIRVVVPHADGRERLFEIGLEELLSQHEAGRAPQPDNALPRLKKAVARQQRQSE